MLCYQCPPGALVDWCCDASADVGFAYSTSSQSVKNFSPVSCNRRKHLINYHGWPGVRPGGQSALQSLLHHLCCLYWVNVLFPALLQGRHSVYYTTWSGPGLFAVRVESGHVRWQFPLENWFRYWVKDIDLPTYASFTQSHEASFSHQQLHCPVAECQQCSGMAMPFDLICVHTHVVGDTLVGRLLCLLRKSNCGQS